MTAMVLSNDGITAINNAGSGGPRVDVTQFKIGADAAFTPLATDTDIHGTLLHTGTVTNYTVLPGDIVEWELLMDQTVGGFNFGNVGLFLASGDLFALAAFPSTRAKVVQDLPAGEIGNRVIIRAQAAITDPTLTLDFTNIVDPNREQWADDARAASYSNSTTFTITGDVTADFTVDRRIKASLGGPFVYSYIESSSYSAPDTTIVVSDPVLTVALTAVDFGILEPGNLNASARTADEWKSIGDGGLTSSFTTPKMTLIETDATAENKNWRMLAIADNLYLRAYDDAFSSFENIFEVRRTDHVVDDLIIENANVTIGAASPGAEALNVTGSITATVGMTVGGNTVWHAGNDGAGSGLDADLLDGVEGAGYSLTAHVHAVATGGVNGFMSSGDKTKLDGIETAATADQTAGEILTLIKTVDGTGSGLDADLVDGLHATAFVRSDTDDSVNGHTNWLDAKEIRFGTSADFKIVHTGSRNLIDSASAMIEISHSGGAEEMAQFVPNGAAIFMYNGTTRLQTSSTGAVTTGTHVATDYDTTSSLRYKENVANYDGQALNALFDKDLNPIVTFQFKEDYGVGDSVHIGMVAEKIAKIDERLVSFDEDGRPESIKTNQVQAVMVKKIQELETRLTEAGI